MITFDDFKKLEIKTCIDHDNPKQILTQTIELISTIAHQDFGLLHINEQETLIEELRNLLRTQLQEDEIKNDTRMYFAISRIIRLIVDWNQDWGPIENKYKELEKYMELVKKNSNKKGLIEEIRNEIEKTNNSIVDKTNKVYANLLEIAFKDLIQTLKSYPDKLRLWKLAVNFCRRTGYNGIEKIISLCKNYESENNNKRPFKYIKAVLWQEIGKELLTASRILEIKKNNKYQENNYYPWEYESNKMFVDNVNGLNEEPYPGDTGEDEYEKINNIYFENCKSLSHFILNKDWAIPHDKPELLFWAENIILEPYSNKPSLLWTKNINEIYTSNPENIIVRNLLLRYPKEISDEQVNKIIALFQKEKKYKTAWEFEHNPNMIKYEENIINLLTWCSFIAKKEKECNEESSYDPRISEWTSLTIIEKICKIYTKPIESNLFSLDSLNKEIILPPLPHPANFILPENWIKKNNWQTWEKWEQEMRENTIDPNSDDQRIEDDYRIYPFWFSEKTIVNERNKAINQLYGLGLLLLGLLRRSFDWPSRWFLPSHFRDWRGLFRELYYKSACSSYTIKILEGILLPIYLQKKYDKVNEYIDYKLDDDKEFDPPLIRNIDELKKEIIYAKDELKKYQISAYKQCPRQLVPINFYSLFKRKWLNEKNI